MTAPPTVTIPRAGWEVMWVVKGPRIIARDFEHNFVEALELYTKVLRAGKKMPTLRCKNVPFPPPDKYADHEAIIKTKVVKKGGRRRRMVVKRNGKPVIEGYELIVPRQYQVRMRHLNVTKGVMWCPYCMQLRAFEKRIGFISDLTGTVVEAEAYYCPMCDIPHTNVGVRRYNPLAGELAFRKQSRRSSGRRSRKRGRRKR